MKFVCKKCHRVMLASSERDLYDHLESEEGIITPRLRDYYYVVHSSMEDVVDFIYNTLYQGYPTKIKEEAVKLMKMLGKPAPHLGVAVVDLHVASEKIACPLNIRKSHSHARKWGVSFWKYLRIFREMYPRKDTQYYLQCIFNEFAQKLKYYHEDKTEAWRLSWGLREELKKDEGILAKLYETTFQILSSLPRKFLMKRPRSLIAGAVYIAGILEMIHLTQRDIALVLDITEPTVRNHYWRMRKVLLDRVEELPFELKVKLKEAILHLE